MKWNDMTEKPSVEIECLFYDDQTGKEFIAYGWTYLPYTYWRELTKQEIDALRDRTVH